jgi:tellurite resistance protein TerC
VIGSKIFIADLLGIDKVPPLLSLLVISSILATGVLYSIFKTRGDAGRSTEGGHA